MFSPSEYMRAIAAAASWQRGFGCESTEAACWSGLRSLYGFNADDFSGEEGHGPPVESSASRAASGLFPAAKLGEPALAYEPSQVNGGAKRVARSAARRPA